MSKAAALLRLLEGKTESELVKQATKLWGPEIPKGKYIGTGKSHDCDKNSYRVRDKYQVYKGEIVYKEDYGWTRNGHIFNVNDQGKVIEMTDFGPDSSFEDVRYFGKPYTGKLKDIWN